MSLFYVYIYVLHELFFIHNVVRLLSSVNMSVHLSCAFYNKLTYLMPCYASETKSADKQYAANVHNRNR